MTSRIRGIEIIIDKEDLHFVEEYNWTPKKVPHGYYFSSSVKGTREVVSLHRLIKGEQTNLYVDHINHDTLDFRRSNLRYVTSRESARNRRKTLKNTSGYIGVSLNKDTRRSKRFRVSVVTPSGRRKELISHKTAIEAAKAYDNYMSNNYDGIIVLNFPVKDFG